VSVFRSCAVSTRRELHPKRRPLVRSRYRRRLELGPPPRNLRLQIGAQLLRLDACLLRQLLKAAPGADLQPPCRRFRKRTGFTYTVLDPASRDVIGCVYIYPLPDSDYDARALSWVRASDAQLDTPLWRAVSEWLASDWPFGSLEYASRA
jgi:hypothetical protein